MQRVQTPELKFHSIYSQTDYHVQNNESNESSICFIGSEATMISKKDFDFAKESNLQTWRGCDNKPKYLYLRH